MKVPMTYFPQCIITKYNLDQLVDLRDNIFITINKGVYSLKQVEILAFQQLAERLEKTGYAQIFGSSGMWKHVTRQKFSNYMLMTLESNNSTETMWITS